MYHRLGIRLCSFASVLVICSILCLSTSPVGADLTYTYFDDFNTGKAEFDSYSHSIFWPEMAFPPGRPYLYYSTLEGNPPQSLVFMDYLGVPAHLRYCLPVPASLVDKNREIKGTITFDLDFPFDKLSSGSFTYSLSGDGYIWTIPIPLPPGHHEIAISSLKGTCYVAFTGTRALIDNLQVNLTSSPDIIYVPADFLNIQQAIDAAANGQIVEVAPGTYTGEGNWDIDFRGKAIIVRSADGPENTIIDCNNADVVSDTHRGFYFHLGEGLNSVLQGFTIKSGRVSGSEIPFDDVPASSDSANPIGAGIYCEFSSPTIINCVIQDCGTEVGGGIGCVGSAPVIIGCTVDRCKAGGFGSSDSGGFGGGIGLIRGSNAKIIDCIVRNNSGYYNSAGGGIYSSNSSAKIMNCEIYENKTIGNIKGGGLYCGQSSNIILENCLIFKNAANIGAAILADSDNAEPKCSIVVKNCTVSHNVLQHAMPPLPAGGIHLNDCDAKVRNTILWYNDGPQILEVPVVGDDTVSFCDVQDGYPGKGNIDQDPLFANILLPDYHLRSLYGRYDPVTGQWVSDLVHSPCIDKGDPNDPVGQEPLPNGERINMGAYGGTKQASKSSRCTVYHVDAVNGDDGNDGLTRLTAFRTIQRGIIAASHFDVVLLWPGVYVEQVNFNGKAITVQSADDPAVVEASSGYVFSFYTNETRASVLRNIIIRDSNYAIYCDGGSPTLSNLTIVNNEFGITAYGGSSPDICNCIFWRNKRGDLFGDPPLQPRYSRLTEPASAEIGTNIFDEPLFANPAQGDFHLLSERGRFIKFVLEPYTNAQGIWILDRVSSPCIDRADPTVKPGGEPMPNGGRLNMGAYGGTAFASMSEWPILGDVNHDGIFNMLDFAIIAQDWLRHLPWLEKPVVIQP